MIWLLYDSIRISAAALMRRDYHNWYSQRLDRNMELLVYGHSGLPMLVFPTAAGRSSDYEDHGMIRQMASKLENGELQVFCIDGVDQESWLNQSIQPYARPLRHLAYEGYVLYEVLPLIHGLATSGQLRATGCGFGGYHALNFALKHPDVATDCVAMSGCYDLKRYMNGHYDDNVYFNCPVDYVPNLNDPWFLDRYRTMRIVLAAGDQDRCRDDTSRMAGIFYEKGISHMLDIWTGGERDDWPLWQRMAVKFF